MKIEKILIDIILPLILCVFIAFKSSDITYDYPDYLHELYEEPMYKLLIFGIIYYISCKNFVIGLLLSIVVVFVLTDIHMLSESFSNYGPDLNNCSIYNKDDIDFTGTAYYPLN